MLRENEPLIINAQTSIPRGELVFEYSHASGPGGQNVNKVSSRVTVCLSIVHCPAFTEEQKTRLSHALGNRLTRDGQLRVSCEEARSQANNRETAILRLIELLATALRPRIKRKASKPTQASRVNRLKVKKQRSLLKNSRKTRAED